MPQLFEIAEAIERLMAEVIDPETGEITDEGLEKLDALEMERDEKALAIARYMLDVASEGERVKLQAERLMARARVHANQAARLKKKLTDWLPVGLKLRDDVVQIGWRRSTAVEVVDPDQLPASCWRQRDPEIDVAGIKVRLKDGEDVPGAKLVTRHHVNIR